VGRRIKYLQPDQRKLRGAVKSEDRPVELPPMVTGREAFAPEGGGGEKRGREAFAGKNKLLSSTHEKTKDREKIGKGAWPRKCK